MLEEEGLSSIWLALGIDVVDGKGQQVKRMGETYMQAEKVFVWLGAINQPTTQVMEDIMRVV